MDARFVKNPITGINGDALLVIAPTISQAGAIAWTIGGFVAGFFIAQRKV